MAIDNDITRRHKAAWQCLQQGDLKEAWRLSGAVNQAAPDFPPGWDLSSRIALASGDRNAALQFIERALQGDHANFSYLSQKAYCLHALQRPEDARLLLDALASDLPESAPECDTLGNLYSLLGDQVQAQRYFENATQKAPDKAHYHLNLALALQANGDLERAEQVFDRVIALKPQDHEAWLHRSRLRRQSPEHNHLEQLEARVKNGVASWRSEIPLRYALAKEHEDLGNHQKSFAHLSHGAKLRRSHMRHDAQADLHAMDAIARNFSVNYLREHTPGCDSLEPIFIVGLPRTGTTLLERILGSHSAVFAAGELNNFAENLSRQIATLGGPKPANREQFIGAATRVDFAALGESYVSSTRPQTGHTPRFIDKLPLNFLYCGLILKALPNARILHLTRHPMDTCYAMYKTLFKQAYPFSYDLCELGEYFLAYRKLMAHWHAAMPGRILDVAYEQLASDTARQTRDIVSYCGLEWEEGCLDFQNNSAPSMTASLAQVRQPVYTSSIGKWQNYRVELAPLADVFARAGLDV